MIEDMTREVAKDFRQGENLNLRGIGLVKYFKEDEGKYLFVRPLGESFMVYQIEKGKIIRGDPISISSHEDIISISCHGDLSCDIFSNRRNISSCLSVKRMLDKERVAK